MSGFGFINGFLEKWSFVPDRVLGGYCRGMGVDRSTWRVLPWHGKWFGVLGGYCRRLEVVMFDWPPILPFNGVPPFLEILLKASKSFL
jgi:hypothetical protein